jgi:hypothetical protein
VTDRGSGLIEEKLYVTLKRTIEDGETPGFNTDRRGFGKTIKLIKAKKELSWNLGFSTAKQGRGTDLGGTLFKLFRVCS